MKTKKTAFFIAICLAMFAANIANSAQGVFLSDYIDHYGLLSAEQGLISVAQNIGCIAVCIVIMLLAGRVNSSSILIFTVSACLLSMLFIGFKPAFLLLLAMYMLFGSSYAGASNISSALTSKLYKGSSSAMGLLHAFFGLGGLIGPIALQAAETRLGLPWNVVCACTACVSLPVLIFYIFARHSAAPLLSDMGGTGQRVTSAVVKAFFSNRKNLLLLLATFGYMSFQNGMNIWIARYMKLELGAESIAAITLSLFWAGNTAARLTVPRLRLRTELLFSAGCGLAAVFLVTGLLIGSAPLMMALTVLAGIASGASVPQLYHMGCVWNSEASLFTTTVLAITMFLSSVATAPLTAAIASGGMLGGMLSVAAYAAVGCAALVPIAVRRKKNVEEEMQNCA